MKKVLLKTAFIMSVIVLMIVLLTPAYLLLDVVLPTWHGSHGLFPGIVVVAACQMAANRVVSLLFLSTRLSDKRWSIFETRRSRSAG
jgi:hypothetical protein